MGGNIVLNIIRTGLVLVLCVLAFLAIRQSDQFERRILEVKGGITDVDKKLRENGKRLEDIERRLAQGVAVAGPGGSTPRGEPDDPRTLPYWPTDDNILVDPMDEPGPPADAPRGGTFNYYLGSNLSNLNDLVNNDAELSDSIAAFVYETLAAQSLNDPDQYAAGLANRVTVSDDKRVFTIYLRKGMHWHPPYLLPEEREGELAWLAELPPQEVTAHDVKFTWDIVRDPNNECGHLASYLLDVESVEVVDDYTLVVTWKKKRYYNLVSTLGLIRVFPRHIWGRDRNGQELSVEEAAQLCPQHWYNKRMCGTGPFRFAGYVDNQYVRLERYDDYWGLKPALDAIVLHVIENQDIRLQRFKAGEIDIFPMEPAQYRSEVLSGGSGSVKEMIDRGEVVLKKWEGATYYYIAWNMRRPIFREAAVRRALAHAFPKERVIRDVYAGLAVPHDSPVHRWDNAYVKDLEQFPFDLDRAAKLLDEAGWKLNDNNVREKFVDGEARQLRFTILLPNSRSVYRDFSLLYQKELAKIGVILELQLQEWNQLTSQLDDKDYDAVSLGWGTSWDSDPEQIWHSRQALVAKGSNHCSYLRQTVDGAIEGLQVEFEPAQRKKLWRVFQETIAHDQPYLFLAIPLRPWVINARMGDTYFSRLRPQIWLVPWYVRK